MDAHLTGAAFIRAAFRIVFLPFLLATVKDLLVKLQEHRGLLLAQLSRDL